jgi:hypothetical protein
MPKKIGFLQALGVTAYCSALGLFFWGAEKVFPKVDNFFAPVLFLLLFSVSALVCGLIVFKKPYDLFFAGKKKEAVGIVVNTALWLLFFLAITFLLVILIK